MSKSEFAGKQHHHGCERCNRRYVCACLTPDTNDVCNSCRAGRVTAAARAWEPQDCCLQAAPLTSLGKDEKRALKLVGPTPWFKCPTCARQFPCQPEEVKIHDAASRSAR